MRLTRAADYTVRCTTYLSRQGIGVLVKKKAIAEAMDIPAQFLSKIAQNLSKAGIIEILQGAKGGLRLIVSPEELTLLTVVEAEIGEILLNDHMIAPQSCQRGSTRAVYKVWERARNQLRNTLNEVTFAQILKDETRLDILQKH
jgi:Rrf2 family protein